MRAVTDCKCVKLHFKLMFEVVQYMYSVSGSSNDLWSYGQY